MISDAGVSAFVLVCIFIGFVFAYINYRATDAVKVEAYVPDASHVDAPLVINKDNERLSVAPKVAESINQISSLISNGADEFLRREYLHVGMFVAAFGLLLLILLGVTTKSWARAALTVVAFICGASTSVLSGFAGMRIATYANSRTCIRAAQSVGEAFRVSFKAGLVMGFTLVCLGILVLFILCTGFKKHFDHAVEVYGTGATYNEDTTHMFEAIAGYGLGGSTVALFGRVGGGIYTKAADVGADLVGKIGLGLDEDSPQNPAVIADNVGDNVGDIAGMGADLFGSFAESACATMVVAANSAGLNDSSQAVGLSLYWPSLLFPLALSSAGLLVCILTSVVATHLSEVKSLDEIEPQLKKQIGVSTVLMTPIVFLICYYFLPHEGFPIGNGSTLIRNVKYWHIFFCIACGLWSGMAIGYITEYFTSYAYPPVREVAEACRTGAATNIIFGLALGYKSVIIPVFCLAITIYVSYSLAGMFGIAVAALGILSTLPISLTIDAYGPICDNAGGIAEMSHMDKAVRDRTDALDAAGNTTAAIGKGFAIGSAALVSLALFGAFVTIVGMEDKGVNLLKPFEFAGLLVGAMLPYWFAAMCMKSVGLAAKGMVEEIERQVKSKPTIVHAGPDGKLDEPDYAACIRVSTDHALHEMIAPGTLVMLTPILVGYFLGVRCLAGVLAGALVSGVQIAVSSANTGGAWDNAKKYIEGKHMLVNPNDNPDDPHAPRIAKGTAVHAAAVTGDTVGDPLKDTSGPSLNILIKLMAIISVVFGPSFASPDKGGLLQQWFS